MNTNIIHAYSARRAPLRHALVLGATLSLPSCGGLAKLVHSAFGLDNVQFQRREPAEIDLPAIKAVAVPTLDGKKEDAETISALLGQWLSSSSRFQLVERDRLAAIAQESGCHTGDVSCFSRSLPASAFVFGSVADSNYREHTETQQGECYRNGKKAACSNHTREGTATVSANLKLVETATGKILFQRLISKSTSAKSSAIDDPAPAIDSVPLLEEARRQTAVAFFEAICPHDHTETVAMAFDGDLPELDRGKEQLKHGQYFEAVKTYQAAAERAEATKSLESETRGKAHYSLGVALAITGEYGKALSELGRARAEYADENWVEVTGRIQKWAADAEAVKRQLAYADQNEPNGKGASSGRAANGNP